MWPFETHQPLLIPPASQDSLWSFSPQLLWKLSACVPWSPPHVFPVSLLQGTELELAEQGAHVAFRDPRSSSLGQTPTHCSSLPCREL